MVKKESEYSKKLRDPRWQKKRLKILERDDWACQKCYDDESTLVVHHRRYLVGEEPWDYPDDLLVTLCEGCHEQERGTRQEYEDMLLSILKEKFFADDLYSLVSGFLKMSPPCPSEVFASVLEWFLGDGESTKVVCDSYFKNLSKTLKNKKNATN
mgnify:CR=1 FL=1